MSIPINLTPAEIMMAATVGALRQAESMLHGREEAHGAPDTDDPLYKHILGACGEIAVARAYERYWGGDVNTFKRADIGHLLQIRMRSRHDWDLIVRPDDNPDHAFMLVTGDPTKMRVHGWCWGRDAKNPDWFKPHGGRPPAYFVPKSFLKPVRRA